MPIEAIGLVRLGQLASWPPDTNSLVKHDLAAPREVPQDLLHPLPTTFVGQFAILAT
jgi:hypothetical protein